MIFYADWGFSGNPFDHKPLLPDRTGSSLLVGRSYEIRKVQKNLNAGGSILPIEGRNGIGKTSLVNVSAYRMYEQYLQDRKSPLIIPCRKTFQIVKDSRPDSFKFDVLLEVAQTLIERRQEIRGLGLDMSGYAQVDSWLNSPAESGWQLGLSDWINFGKSAPGSASSGYEASGFARQIEGWLKEIFPNPDWGGVCCIIDNIELLETSKDARRTIEVLRDEIFTIPGLRWVLCGANGIINSIVSSPRLEGYLGRPIVVERMSASGSEIFQTRIKFFTPSGGVAYMPLLAEDFGRIYTILNYNLRSTLHHSHNYCDYIDSEGLRPESDEDKRITFDRWLRAHAQEIFLDIKNSLKPKSWSIFDQATSEAMNGSFSPGNHSEFGFETPQALRPYVKDLEEHGLVISSWDEEDQRRKSIQVTPKGWLINYARIVTQ